MADSKKRSRGPKTPNGKASPSHNSTKHGCTGKTLVLSGESHEEFDAMRAGRLKEFGQKATKKSG